MRRCVETIAAAPELFGVVEDDFRAAPLKRFPQLVYYRVEADRVFVVAVQHRAGVANEGGGTGSDESREADARAGQRSKDG